jgi:hypothetical protein
MYTETTQDAKHVSCSHVMFETMASSVAGALGRA